MSNIDSNNTMTMQELLDQENLTSVKRGSIVEGSVILVSEDEVMVDIGSKSDGIVPRNEVFIEVGKSLKEMYQAGDKVKVYVIKTNDGDGNLLLSIKKAEAVKVWDDIQSCFDQNATIKVKVKEVVKGGLSANFKDLRVFIPASHVSASFVDDLKVFLGKELEVKIIEFDKEKRKFVVSRKVIEKEEESKQKREVLEKLEEGMTVSGSIKRITDFGAFVDLGGIDGLIHLSELSWKRVKSAKEVVSIGDKVETFVLSVDKEKEKISLSLKKLIKNPWEKVEENYQVGQVIEGKVLRLPNFGAFIEVESGLDGFCHISQICQKHIAKPSDVLKEGEIVKAKIIEINKEQKRLALSIKELDENNEEVDVEKYNDDEPLAIIKEIIE